MRRHVNTISLPLLRWAALPLFLLAAACVTIPKYDYANEPDPRKLEFVLGPADGVKIGVWKNPDLNTDTRLRPDGTITMPLIGDIPAAGRTPSQLKAEITQRLSIYVKDETATVSVTVTEVNSYRYTVSGNVERGGIFSSKYYVTVGEAIAMAGGVNKFGDPSRLQVIRNQGGKLRRIPIDYRRIADGSHPEENLALFAGDILYVP